MNVANAIRMLRFTLLYAAASSSVWAQQYVRIDAEINQTNYNQRSGKVSSWSFPLTCVVGTNEWHIANAYAVNGQERWYYDGTNVYHSLLPAYNLAQDGSLQKKREPSNQSDPRPFEEKPNHITVAIAPSPGGHPLGNLGANLPWLAFCSGSYLKRAGRVIPLPVVDIRGTTDSLAYTDKTETFKDGFGLPKVVELFTSRAQYQTSLYDERLYRNSSLQEAQLRPALKFAEGVLRFHYVVRASTNFNEVSFPIEFAYFDYRPDGAGKWDLVAAGVGKVISIREGHKPENVFLPDTVQVIVDMRFRHKTKLLDAITYTWTNTFVPSTNDPVLQAMFAAKAARVGTAHPRSPGLFRYPLLAIFFLPIVFFAFKYSRQKQQQKTTSEHLLGNTNMQQTTNKTTTKTV